MRQPFGSSVTPLPTGPGFSAGGGAATAGAESRNVEKAIDTRADRDIQLSTQSVRHGGDNIPSANGDGVMQ
jgi:hypothetical protein